MLKQRKKRNCRKKHGDLSSCSSAFSRSDANRIHILHRLVCQHKSSSSLTVFKNTATTRIVFFFHHIIYFHHFFARRHNRIRRLPKQVFLSSVAPCGLLPIPIHMCIQHFSSLEVFWRTYAKMHIS